MNCVATDTSGNSTPPTNLFDLDVRDTTAPVITLAGAAVMNVELKSAFTDPGATAVDVVSAVVTVTRTGTVNTNVAGSYTLSYVATDAAGNTTTATRTVIVADTQPPVIDTSATPNVLLWSPNKTMTPVTVSGTAIDANLVSVTFAVVDEYKKVQPSGTVSVNANGTYAFVIKLEAYRNGNDSNGRVYTITVTARDASGRTAATSTVVLVRTTNKCHSAGGSLARVSRKRISRDVVPQRKVRLVVLHGALLLPDAILRACQPVLHRHGVAERRPVVEKHVGRLANLFLTRFELDHRFGIALALNVGAAQHETHQPEVGQRPRRQ